MDNLNNVKSECKCDKCQKACANKPGWFLPGEIEKVAEHLHVSVKQLFDAYLGVDWWEHHPDHDYEDVLVIAPAMITMSPGTKYPENPFGQCIFFKNGLCEIHRVKPFECADYICSEDKNDVNIQDRHYNIAKSWIEHKNQVTELWGLNG